MKQISFRLVVMFIVLLAPLTIKISLADCWWNVTPHIQEYFEAGVDLPIEAARIYNVGLVDDDLWPANELARQLQNPHVVNPEENFSIAVTGPLPVPPHGIIPAPHPNERIIWIGLWNEMQEYFFRTNEFEMHHAPGLEEYYILVDHRSANIYITASTRRGLNYAVTTFWQAICPGENPTIEAGAVRDYPKFSKRYIANFHPLAEQVDYMDSGNHSWQENTADSLLKAARDIMLYDKANGLIHAGRTEEYSDGASFGDEMDDVMDVLEEGRLDDSWGRQHGDRWRDFGFDWHEGVSWIQSDATTQNFDSVYRRIQVETSCGIYVPQSGDPELRYDYTHPSGGASRPHGPGHFKKRTSFNPVTDVDNSSFETFNANAERFERFTGWNMDCDGWQRAGSTGAFFAEWSSVASPDPLNPDANMVWMESAAQVLWLDSSGWDGAPATTMEFGPPARQMILEFKVKANGAGVHPKVHIMATHRPRWDFEWRDDETDPNAVWSFLPPPDGWSSPSDPGDGPNLPEELRIIDYWELSEAASNNTWTTYQLLFNTYGVTSVELRLEVRNYANTARTVGVDDIKFFDADFYDVMGSANSQWSATVTLYDNQWAPDGTDVTQYLTFTEKQTSNTIETWRIHHAKATLSSGAFGGHNPADFDSAVVLWWTGTKIPKQITVPTYPNALAGDPGGTFQWNVSRRELRSDPDAADEFSGLMSRQAEWFEDKFRDHDLGEGLAGFHFKENEFKTHGYMPSEISSSFDGQTQYGQFVQQMYNALPDPPGDVPCADPAQCRPLIMWGDMFDVAHNGQRFVYRNNLKEPYLGFKRPAGIDSYEIPGMNSVSPITYIWWQLIDRHNPPRWPFSRQFWSSIVDGNYNNYDVILGLGNADANGQQLHEGDLTEHFRGLLNAAWNDQQSRGFTGGMLFDWFGRKCIAHDEDGDCVQEENANFDRYYLWEDLPDSVTRSGEWLQWLWRFSPIQEITEPFESYCDHAIDSNSVTLRVYPLPERPQFEGEANIDSVVLQYRIGLTGTWQSQRLSKRNDSLYTFTLSLPDSGGVVEYRSWAFDSFGGWGALPGKEVDWNDPDAGERYYFTFERRKTDPIEVPTTFYAPGIISMEHEIVPGGSITIEPLPGYRYATMYLTDAARIGYASGTGNDVPRFTAQGTDTSQIRFALADSSTHWQGIDDRILVTLKHVIFETGTDPFKLPKILSDSAHVFDDAVFTSPLEIADSTSVKGTATISNLKVNNGAVLTIEPGSDFAFSEHGRLLVENEAKLQCAALDTLRTVFREEIDSLGWEGIHLTYGAKDTSVFRYCDIEGANAGILVDRTAASLEKCNFTGCRAGLLVADGGNALVSTCEFTDNQDAIVLANLATASLSDCEITNNSGTGVMALSRSTAYLTDCNISQNNGDGLAGGIGLYTGSEAFLKCTSVNENTGPGITSFGGVVMLSSVDTAASNSVQWRGSSVFDNATVDKEGQITLRGRVGLAMFNGHNRVADSTGTHELIAWEDQPTRDWWKDTYWGETDTSDILDRLPANVLLSQIDSSWTACQNFGAAPGSPDSLMRVFLSPHSSELAGSYTTAKNGYTAILKSTPNSDYAFAGADRLLSATLAAGDTFSTPRSFLDSLASATSVVSLRNWLLNAKAWCWAEEGDSTKAWDLYDSLANHAPTRLDRVNAQVQKQMLLVRHFAKDSTRNVASQVLARVDTSRQLLARMNVWTQMQVSNGDSVVMFAPTSVDGNITIAPSGVLTIVAHPGTEEPIVSFRGDGAISCSYAMGGSPRGKLYVRGTADRMVVLEWDSTSAWGNIVSSGGYVDLLHARLRGRGFVNANWDIGTPIFKADSCIFEGFDEGIWVDGITDVSYIRNSTLCGLGGGTDYLGLGFGTGLTCLGGTGFTIENCTFENNGDMGLLAFGCGGLEVISTEITGSGEYGMLVWSGGAVTLDCGTLTANGDTLPELWVEDGSVDLVGAHTEIADSNGTLVYTGEPAFVDLEDGENEFALWSSNGIYLKSGDTTDTWNITWNTWDPVIPTSGTFYDHLYPHTPGKWTVDSSLATFLACGDGEGDLHDGGPDNVLVGESADAGIMNAGSHSGKQDKSQPRRSKIVSKPTKTSAFDARSLHEQELADWRRFKEVAKSSGKGDILMQASKFISGHPGSELTPGVLVRIAALANSLGKGNEVSRFLLDCASDLPDARTQVLAQRLGYRALAQEGQPATALHGLEAMMDNSGSRQDSIRALVDAMGVYYFDKGKSKLQPRYAQIRTDDMRDFAKRIQHLARVLDNTAALDDRKSAPLPTQYILYQNFPNPFNPNTEIRFDLPEAVQVQLKIFNVLGQEVATLVDAMRPAGAYNILWDSKTSSGMTVASGVYVYQIKAGNFTDQKKMVLIR